jgi:hypothetical protein
MAVYVDDMYKNPIGQFGRLKMSHLIADTPEELLEMVDKIGVQRKWIQHPGTKEEHFDIAMVKRELAIKYGAIPMGMYELCKMWLARKGNNDNLIPPDNTTITSK